MTTKSGFVTPICIAATVTAAFIAAAQDAPKQQFTARELFYKAEATPVATTAKPIAKPPQKTSTVVATRQPATPTTTNAGTKIPPSTPISKPPVSTSPDGEGRIIQASTRPATAPEPTSGPALGLKYTILKWSGSENVEVPPDTAFRAGDRIQVSVQTNGPGYLYIVNQGSSGTWKPMFPSPEIADGDNRVDGWHAYSMPPKSRMVFDEQVGTEKLFIIFSREPEPEFENLIYSLKGGAKPTPAKPVSQPDASPKPQKQMLVVANLNIQDSAIDRMRKTYSRDLIIERVDESTPGDRKEKAVYVVNPTGSSASRVVADLQLAHK